MPIAVYTFLWLLASVGLFLLGFMTGRCARKFPVLDHVLPWTMHWLYTLQANESPSDPGKQTATNPPRTSG